MNQRHVPLLAALLLLLASAPTLPAQMSVQDAEKKLHDRLATRPATTQPMSEIDRLREQNTQLREENFVLLQEIHSLHAALDRLERSGAAAAPPTTQPASPATRPAQATAPAPAVGPGLVGHWRGGSPDNGSAFFVTFNADGTYQQSWIAPPQSESGHYQLNGDGTVEMWSDRARAGAPHHLWRTNLEDNRVTLTPLLANGEASTDLPQVLTRMEK